VTRHGSDEKSDGTYRIVHKQPPSVAIVMPLAKQLGGGELSFMHLMMSNHSGLVSWRVVFLEDGPMVEQVRGLGIPATVIAAGRMRQAHKTALTLIRLVKYLRRERIDLVIGWMAKAHLYASMPAWVLRIPAVWYNLGLSSRFSWMDRWATRLPARVILTNSKATRDSQASLRPLRPLRVVYPGVEIDRFNPDSLSSVRHIRTCLGLGSDGPVIGIVGRLQRWKGMHVVIEAMPSLVRDFPSAHCIIVGGRHSLEPEYEAFLRERIRALGLGGQIHMVGEQTNVEEWMQAMDVFVHASDAEPFGMVIIEAMALGKPVVSTSSGGPLEIIEDGVNGMVLPGATPEELAASIKRYLNDAAFAARIGEAAKLRARHFSTERFADELSNAVLSVLGRTSDAAFQG
jgi:glycosyltransferase involved in cell wall biosynthesis